MRTETIKSGVLLVVCLAVSFAPSAVGVRSGPDSWYAGLTKPSLTPPGWVFPIVWTILYATMGVAAWLVIRAVGLKKGWLPLTAFAVQLILNGLWSYIFFTLHRPGMAMIELAVLWAAIVATVILFFRVRRPAGALLLPYLVWVTFAGYLNVEIYRLNV